MRLIMIHGFGEVWHGLYQLSEFLRVQLYPLRPPTRRFCNDNITVDNWKSYLAFICTSRYLRDKRDMLKYIVRIPEFHLRYDGPPSSFINISRFWTRSRSGESEAHVIFPSQDRVLFDPTQHNRHSRDYNNPNILTSVKIEHRLNQLMRIHNEKSPVPADNETVWILIKLM